MNQFRHIVLLLLCSLFVQSAQAQGESTSIYHFLSLPTSAHVMALGGANVSLPDDDAALLLHNPALMSNASDRAIALGAMSYMSGVKAGNAAWTQAASERGTWGMGAQFVSYGSMTETDVNGAELGTFSSLDMAISGGYSYVLSEFLSGGATGKMVYSKYGEYSSLALAVDLGLNMFDEDHDFSASLVAANLGGQVKRFADHSERLPFDLRAGFTKRLENAPFRFSVTMTDLTRWRARDYYNPDGKEGAGHILLNHFVLGVDLLLSEQFYVAGGFNCRRARELKAAGSSHGAGLSLGAGLNLKRFKVGVSYAKYHVSTSTLMLSAQYNL